MTTTPSPDAARVLLMGLMGAGKSTVGRALAERLDCAHLDNDELLVEQERASIRQLAERGAVVLHTAESRALRSLAEVGGPWVAGAAASLGDRPADCAFVRDHFVPVYLHVEPAVLAWRVRQDPWRPWVGADPSTTLQDMYVRRDPELRATARVVVDGSRSVTTIVTELVAALGAAADAAGEAPSSTHDSFDRDGDADVEG